MNFAEQLVTRLSVVPDPDGEAERAAIASEGPVEKTPPDDWPILTDEALIGLAGAVVRTIDPHTEADPAAILLQFLIAFGNCAGVSPFYRVGADEHRCNLFGAIVGDTSKARKGTSEGQVRRLFDQAAPEWASRSILHGLASGEGLIQALKSNSSQGDGSEQHGDPRMLVIEPEFANVLHAMRRDGSTLSGVLRQAWDRGSLRVMTRREPLRVDGVHLSLICHVTEGELLTSLESKETGNGFANRFLWIVARRSKLLPDGGSLSDSDLKPLREQLERSLDRARRSTELKRDSEAAALWRTVYRDLTADRAGLMGSVTSRAEAQVTRLALIYALLDCESEIRRKHMEAALAFWSFCDHSAMKIFGGRLGNPIANRILRELREGGEMTRTAIMSDLFARNAGAAQIEGALELLERAGLASRSKQSTGGRGRPAESWRATS